MASKVAWRPIKAETAYRDPVWLAGVWGALRRMMEVAEQRRKLGQLDERALQDIGVTRSQAAFEAGRAPWDLPKLEDERQASAETGRWRGGRRRVKCPG